MRVRFVNLYQLHNPIIHEIHDAMDDVAYKGDFINGTALQEFEEKWAKYCGKKYCVGLSSGFHALQLSKEAIRKSQQQYVMMPSNSFIATASAFYDMHIIFHDINPENHLIKSHYIDFLGNSIYVPVHLFGQPCDSKTIELAKKNNVTVIEDACQAHGSKHIGFGDIQCWSFYPSKNLGCFGDGGAITTNNQELAEKIRMLANYGAKEKYKYNIIGYNCRLDTIQAAILNVKLNYLDEWNKKRQEVAKSYHEKLSDEIKGFKLLPYNNKSVYHLFVVESDFRDELKGYLFIYGVETSIHYPVPIHKTPAFKLYNNYSLPITEEKAAKILSLPIHPYLTEKEIEYVCDIIKKFYKEKK